MLFDDQKQIQMKPYVEGFKKLKHNLKPSTINKMLSETFVNVTFCHNCQTLNYTCARVDEKDSEKDGWMFCKKCGHVHYVENQMVWH